MSPPEPLVRLRSRAALAAALLSCAVAPAPPATAGASDPAAPLEAVVTIVAPPGEVFPGDVFEGEVVIESGAAIGSYSVDVDCDPALFSIAGVRGGAALEFSGPPISNVSGCSARVSGFQVFRLDGPTGDVSVAYVSFGVARDAPPTPSAALDLTVAIVTDTAGAPVAAVGVDGNVSVGSRCGNGVLDEGEGCDDGDAQWDAGQWCNAQCLALLCGDADDSGGITVVDALFTLRVSVGIDTCSACVCDADGSGPRVTATDALRVLSAAAGLDVQLACPVCS